MGWCSATYIFDNVASFILDEEKELSKKEILKQLINELEDGDWDCQQDSSYWETPAVRKAFLELHPEWFEEDA